MGRPDLARQLPLQLREAPATSADGAAPQDPTLALTSRLARALGAPLTVRVTDNRRTMLSIRRAGGVRYVRIHHMFVGAPPEVLDAVARYLAHGDRRAGERIDRHVRENGHRIRPAPPARVGAGSPRGAVHDLAEILRDLVERHCPDAEPVAIAWGRAGASRRRGRFRTIRLGAYLYDRRAIRIHPALDQAWVPRFFVEWVVFHELLHHVTPAPEVGGRRRHHNPEFRAREADFPGRERAVEWERRNVRRLIAARDL